MRCTLIALLGAVLGIAVSASAGTGRDFSGFYELSNVAEAPDEVSVTFTVRVFNHSDADVHDVTLTLEDPLLPDQEFGTLQSTFIGSGGSIVLRGDFVLPAREYESWQKGVPPTLRIEFSTAAEASQRGRVELIPMPGVGGL